MDDDDLYGDLEGDDGGLDLYGGLVEEVKKPAEKKSSPPPEKEVEKPATVQQQHTSSITNSGYVIVPLSSFTNSLKINSNCNLEKSLWAD